MDFLDIAPIVFILLCRLVSGFIFTYTIFTMPGLSNLNDKIFLSSISSYWRCNTK